MNVAEAIRKGTRFLSLSGIQNPKLDAEIILGDLTRQDRVSLHSYPERQLNDQEETVFWEWLDRRARKYPIQYLRHKQEFYGREFQLGPAVLIPRPETEIVVESCLQLMSGMKPERQQILDWGTGSGCIAITLAAEAPRAQITATDISPEALRVARQNASRHRCPNIAWLLADGLTPFRQTSRFFDLIVSNPPYIALEDPSVDPSVALYEPFSSVYSGITGLESYRLLLNESRDLIREEGFLILELGYQQAQAVTQLAFGTGWELLQIKKDLAGIDRCLVLRRSSPELFDHRGLREHKANSI